MTIARRISFLVCLLGAVAFAAEKRDGPLLGKAEAIHPRLRERAERQERVRVMIVLTEQPHRDILERVRRENRPRVENVESRYRQLSDRAAPGAEVRAARDEWNVLETGTRRTAFASIAGAIAPSQSAVEDAVAQSGGTLLQRHQAINMLAVEVPSAALDTLARHPLIAEMFLLEIQSTQLQTSVPALGAGSFWTAGFTGASQSIALLDSGVRTNHPAFAGLGISNQIFLALGQKDICFGDDATSPQDLQGHGTHVAGILASRGASECVNCRGVARGLGTLYNLKIGYLIKNDSACTLPGGGSADSGDVYAAIGWLTQNTPVRILNYSYGSAASQDDDPLARTLDQLADVYGLLPVVAAGNLGSAANTVTSPGIAYNILSVANWSSRGTISTSSGRGPTIGGRSKPDIAAPGTGILSTANNWESAADFVTRSGTSMATPHIAGAAALLTEAGVNDPLAIRAVLINSTDNPGWNADSGWGYANLDKARTALFWATGSVTAKNTPGSFQLYRVRAGGALRVTATWNRHVVNGSSSVFHDLDMISYVLSTNSVAASAGSADDNVEQFVTSGPGEYVVKVRMFNTALGGGISSERFAVAFSESDYAAMTGPQLKLACTAPATALLPSTAFSVTCTATNTGDLPAFGVTGSVTLPIGFSGQNSLTFGTVDALSGAKSVTLNLTAPATTGTFALTGAITSTTYEETFAASGGVNLTVVFPQPAVPAVPSPADTAANASVTPLLTWTASENATSYDIYFGTSPTPPLAANTTGLTYSPGTLAGETTYYWRVIAKNSAGSAASPVWSFATAVILVPPAFLSPANGAANVAISSVLSWSGSGSGITYDVYFGNTATPPLVLSTASLSYAPPTLAGGTTYYWRVVARKGSVSTASPTWFFSTVATGFGSAAPVVVFGTPVNPAGSPQTFTFAARDADGVADISRIYFLVNPNTTVASGTCHGYYDRAANSIVLFDDSLSTPLGPLAPGTAATLENSQCAIDGATSSVVAAAGTDLTIRLGMSMKGAFASSIKNVYLWIADKEGNGTGWVQTGTWGSLNLNRPPTLGTATPALLSGSPAALTFTATDPDGYNNLSRVYFLVNTDTSIPPNSCHGYYDRAANALYLYNDALNVLLGPVTPGASLFLQNSQCSLDGANSAFIDASGTNLTIRLGMSLIGAFAAADKKLYLWVTDAEGNGTGWQQAAAWAASNLNRPPVVFSGTPTTPVGSPQTFTFTLRDPDGASDLNRTYFLVNADTTVPANTCHGYYDRIANGLFLYNDGLTALIGPLTPGASGILQNSQCIIDGASSALAGAAGTDLTLRLGMSLKAPYSSVARKIYLWVTDNEGNGTGWVQTGAWGATTGALVPAIVSAAPAAPVGTSQTFTIVARSPVGYANLNRIYFLVNGSANVPTNSCHGYYDRPSNNLYLYNDSLSVLQGPLTPGAAGRLQNSQCVLDGPTSTVPAATGSDLTLNLGLSLKSTFASNPQNVYLWATDAQNNGTGWVNIATWTGIPVSSPVPVVLSGIPFTASGASQIFAVTGRDLNGFADLFRVYFLVNPANTVPRNSCHGYYDRLANAFFLYNDALSAVSGPLTPGSAGTIQNSQCALDGANSTISSSGTDFTIRLGLRRFGVFATRFQNVFVWIRDNEANETGWVQVSGWNP